MNSEILSIESAALFDEAVGRAAALLRSGQLVALPTETVYGLAANAWDAQAVRRIYEAKGRPPENPIIVHVAGLEMARRCVSTWPALADKLAAAFWPGPLTLVLPRSPEIPPIVTAGGETVGVRWPSHPFIQAVIRACGFPLAAPSANRANELSPTNPRHVQKSLGEKVPLIIDGGQSQVGIESSVIDLVSSPPRLLRPGMIHAESLLAAISEGSLETGAGSSHTLRSPGLLPRHYSPRARLVVLSWTDEAHLAASVCAFNLAREKIHVVAHTQIPLREKFGRVAVIPHDAEAYARALYAELHQCDEAGAELIIAEAVPTGGDWSGIADRLERASHPNISGRR
ncbi:MAG TPA: L-threonylcarbamoyladenylate synthase [Verrucomicrobiae bacterium]|jgi:L-threonylcarbamoyladenylate synthase|nr:L-threonylcarbamoyladenylate synthase [Verrucomicrobiae bacterium]